MFERDSMTRGDMERARSFGVGLIVGALAGAAAGLLMAPAAGAETREHLRRGARRVYSRASEAVGDRWEDADRQYRKLSRTGMKRARKQAERARELAGDFVGRKRFSWR